MGWATDLDVRGPVAQIDTLRNGRMWETTRISTDGRSATVTRPGDAIFRGEYRYDSARRRLDYRQEGADGRLTFFTAFSARGCPERSEAKPAQGSGFPPSVTLARCDARNRTTHEEERFQGASAPVVTTLVWDADGRRAQVRVKDSRGRVSSSEEHYDARGRFVGSAGTDANGSRITTTVTYSDDVRGNWLGRRTVTAVHFACKPDPYRAKYGLGCKPDPKPRVEVEQRRIVYR